MYSDVLFREDKVPTNYRIDEMVNDELTMINRFLS